MAEKVTADEMRDMSIKELQRFINDQEKEKTGVLTPTTGSAPNPNPQQSVRTIKKNIARAKTVLNERTDPEVKA